MFMGKDINQEREVSLEPNNVCIIATLGYMAQLQNKYSRFPSPVQLEIICGYDSVI